VTGAIGIDPSGTLTDELDSTTSQFAITSCALFVTVGISVPRSQELCDVSPGSDAS
jgi:hypothetical protein